MAILSKTDKNNNNNFLKKTNDEKKQAVISVHFPPFSPISWVEQWPQAIGAATYQAKC
jgi:hypothetical protein